MTRIIIEIDDTRASSTTIGPTRSAAAPPELLARAMELGATDAGSAPGVASAAAELATAVAMDAGAAPVVSAAASEYAEDSKTKKAPR